MYCKRGYFRWGKISRECWQDISRGGYFHDTTPNSFIKVYGFYFCVGVIFAKKTKARKTRKLPPRENFHVYSISLRLRSKTRRRAILLFLTWICSCQSVGRVNLSLSYTTTVTISISILQIFRSLVATSHLRPPMAFLSHNSSNTPGLAPLMNILFWGQCDFPVSFSGRDMSRNVWNCGVLGLSHWIFLWV